MEEETGRLPSARSVRRYAILMRVLSGSFRCLVWWRRAAQLLADDRLGSVQLGYVYVGRVTDWHDRPGSFLETGPLYDDDVYPLSLLVAWFGPVNVSVSPMRSICGRTGANSPRVFPVILRRYWRSMRTNRSSRRNSLRAALISEFPWAGTILR